MKYFLNLFVSLFFCLSLSAQKDASFSIYLVGDAGEDTIAGKALLILQEQLESDPNSAVVFLGDNVYPSGFSLKDHSSKLRLESQLKILKNYKGQVYFIPGNHDWDAQRRKGHVKIKEQQVYVNEYLRKNSNVLNKEQGCFFPKDALPGPETVMLNDSLRLIMIDTQWFLHFHKKNKTGSTKQTTTTFYERMDSLLAYSVSEGQQVIVAGHHPMLTNGEHSRKMQPWRFLVNYTPFRIFGLFGLDRLFSQDISQAPYKRMRKRMMASFDKYNNIVYVAGHEHNVQCFNSGKVHYIVSGNGSKSSHLKSKKLFDSFFQDDSSTGFVKLEYFTDKRVITSIYRVTEEVKVLEGY
jgi:predicted phosphodiesterase